MSVEEVLHSRTSSFLRIKLYVAEKEDRAKETPLGRFFITDP